MSLASINKVELLKDRAEMLALCRRFFSVRNVLEVDVPILSRKASVDLHIDLIEARCCGQTMYLHSSPEYGMKQLLAEKIGDIYQISHVFRDYERGAYHTPEFMLVEWYRIGFSFEQMIDETLQFIGLFVDTDSIEYERFSYYEAFMHFVGQYPQSIEARDALYGFEIEPRLGKGKFSIITDFPPEQAALAKLSSTGMAKRFEIYYNGVELANGYHELTDSHEQRERILHANQERKKIGKMTLPLDEEFIEALERGVPDCCGVAVGFDRLMMLRHSLSEIRDASCFSI